MSDPEKKRPVVGKFYLRKDEDPCVIEFRGVRVEMGSDMLEAVLFSAIRVNKDAFMLLDSLMEMARALETKEQRSSRWDPDRRGNFGETDLSALEELRDHWRGRLRGEHREDIDMLREEARGHL